MSDNVEPEASQVSSEENKSTGHTDEKKHFLRGFFNIFIKLILDMLILLFVIYSLATVVHNVKEPKLRPANKPSPFFSEESRVRDYYNGNVYKAFEDAAVYENAFFMIYAPWDRESQEARPVLETVASYMSHTDIMIAAVNCWYPASDCAKGFGSKNGGGDYPFFMFTNNLGMNGVRYRGPLRAEAMLAFLRRVRYPLMHLHSTQHLSRVQVEYSSVLLTYLPSTSVTSLDNNHMAVIQASLMIAEHLPESGVVVCGVTSEKLAKQLHLHTSQPVRLLTWNSTAIFPNRTVEAERLLTWVMKHNDVATAWLRLAGKKSLRLSKILQGSRSTSSAGAGAIDETGGPQVMLVFTPRFGLGLPHPTIIHPVFQQIRQIAAEYYNCDNQENLNSLAERLSSYGGHSQSSCFQSHATGASWFTHRCHLKSWSSSSSPPPACSLATSYCQANSSGCEDELRLRQDLRVGDPNIQLLLTEVASEKENSELLTPSIRAHTGACQADPVEALDASQRYNIRALGCKNNSLSIYAVDSSQYESLLNSLGLMHEPQPLPVILNVKEESVNILGGGGGGGAASSIDAIRQAIWSWHHHQLVNKPGFRSTNKASSVRYSNSERSSAGHSVIAEISAASFSKAVLSSKKDVVLLYTSRFCTHCSVASFAFHTVKLYLSHLQSVKFLMIDGTKNDLNWQFTALSFPTVMFFPRGRSDMSRVFPTDHELNTTNLLSFVVSNLGPAHRLTLALAHCDAFCRAKVSLSASSTVFSINLQLRRHRLTNQMRSVLVNRLNFAKQVLKALTTFEESSRRSDSSSQMPRTFYRTIVDQFRTDGP